MQDGNDPPFRPEYVNHRAECFLDEPDSPLEVLDPGLSLAEEVIFSGLAFRTMPTSFFSTLKTISKGGGGSAREDPLNSPLPVFSHSQSGSA